MTHKTLKQSAAKKILSSVCAIKNVILGVIDAVLYSMW